MPGAPRSPAATSVTAASARPKVTSSATRSSTSRPVRTKSGGGRSKASWTRPVPHARPALAPGAPPRHAVGGPRPRLPDRRDSSRASRRRGRASPGSGPRAPRPPLPSRALLRRAPAPRAPPASAARAPRRAAAPRPVARGRGGAVVIRSARGPAGRRPCRCRQEAGAAMTPSRAICAAACFTSSATKLSSSAGIRGIGSRAAQRSFPWRGRRPASPPGPRCRSPRSPGCRPRSTRSHSHGPQLPYGPPPMYVGGT